MSADIGGHVGLVFVSHSALIADGLVDLVRQMAPTVSLVAAGGTDDGGIGTSFERIGEAIAAADSQAGVVILCDLGSAILTAETAIDFLDDDVRDRVVIADAPLVEGAVAAGVAAETGSDLSGVVAAARSAIASFGSEPSTVDGAADAPAPASGADPVEAVSRTVTLINPNGLHARPAAEFVTLAASLGTKVTVNGKDAASLLGVMSLGLTKGDDVTLIASGAGAEEALGRLGDLIESGFGEV